MIKHLPLFLFLGCTQLQAQNKEPSELPESFLDRTEFKASYFGNLLWNNGINVGAEYLWKENSKVKERKRSNKTITHQFLLNGNLGVTTNFFNNTNTGLFTNYGLTWRRTNHKGKQISVEFNPLGYYRSFLPETYEVNGDDVDKVFLAGRGYYSPSLSIGFGKQRKGKKLTGRYFNVNFSVRTDYNAGSLPVVSLEYGYRFNFKKKK